MQLQLIAFKFMVDVIGSGKEEEREKDGKEGGGMWWSDIYPKKFASVGSIIIYV